jgi:fibro-slime domain-containing protein
LIAAGILPLLLPGAPFMEVAAGQALPEAIYLTGVVRDFRATHEPGGHPDFEKITGAPTVGLVRDTLDSDGKPQFKDQKGQALDEPFLDVFGRPMNPAFYDPDLGDTEGDLNNTNKEMLTSAADFAAWYRDVPGINLSVPLRMEFVLQPDDTYVFDSETDPAYLALEGFFPINERLFGTYPGPWKKGEPDIPTNYHFTLELEGKFVHEAGAGHVFTFRGDDDVWVFVDGRLVIDLGGVHGAHEQSVALDRLDWLVDGQEYVLKFFYAERHTNSANCRIQTTFLLQNTGAVSVSSGCD